MRRLQYFSSERKHVKQGWKCRVRCTCSRWSSCGTKLEWSAGTVHAPLPQIARKVQFSVHRMIREKKITLLLSSTWWLDNSFPRLLHDLPVLRHAHLCGLGLESRRSAPVSSIIWSICRIWTFFLWKESEHLHLWKAGLDMTPQKRHCVALCFPLSPARNGTVKEQQSATPALSPPTSQSRRSSRRAS
jgi:hypothetical protein